MLSIATLALLQLTFRPFTVLEFGWTRCNDNLTESCRKDDDDHDDDEDDDDDDDDDDNDDDDDDININKTFYSPNKE